MGPALEKLLQIAGAPMTDTAPFFAPEETASMGPVAQPLEEVLGRKNGFVCFESALRFFPSVTTEESWGLADWNRHDLWKADYRGLADEIFCFAEDLFCRQFCCVRKEIGVFEPETAEIEIMASTLEDWATKLLRNYSEVTGWRIAHDWQVSYGPLQPRTRLIGKLPFVLGGPYELANLAAIDSASAMRGLGNLAYQIHRLPDGAKVKFKMTE